MGRNTAEQSRPISIFWLKKQGLLDDDYRAGSIDWTWGFSGEKSSISYAITKNSNNTGFMRLRYYQTDRWNGEKTNLDYNIQLASTPCNYGGKRYWFICPLSTNGHYCGRRVGVLYHFGKYWGCRHCGNIAYSDQAASKRYRGMVCIPDVDKAEAEVKRMYYRGKPTKKYQRYLDMEDKFNYSFLKIAGALGS